MISNYKKAVTLYFLLNYWVWPTTPGQGQPCKEDAWGSDSLDTLQWGGDFPSASNTINLNNGNIKQLRTGNAPVKKSQLLILSAQSGGTDSKSQMGESKKILNFPLFHFCEEKAAHFHCVQSHSSPTLASDEGQLMFQFFGQNSELTIQAVLAAQGINDRQEGRLCETGGVGIINSTAQLATSGYQRGFPEPETCPDTLW